MLALVESELILRSLLLSVDDEVYLFDAKTLGLLYASERVKKKLGSDMAQISPDGIERVLGVSAERLLSGIQHASGSHTYFEMSLAPALSNQDDNTHPLRVMLIESSSANYILVTKTDHPTNERVTRALTESESRFQAIVSNIPGLVFQMQMDAKGQLHFVYLSEGCDALLGMTEEDLQQDAEQLLSIMNTKDRAELRNKLEATKTTLERLDWEGRVWIDGWQDTKWINMRATTVKLPDGTYQWSGIMFNITQSKIEKQQIEQSRRDLEQLTAHMNQIKEQERISIAREIHDDLGGNLTAIKMGLASMAQLIQAGKPVNLEQTQNLESIVNRTFEAVHRISGNLRPSVLDLGIVDAIEWQLNQFKKQVGLDCQFKTNQSEISLSTEQAMALFRICQESLSNIAKYAKATQVKVDINVNETDVNLTIIDNGVGLQEADKIKPNAFGLRGMHERVGALHGTIHMGPPDNATSGTQIKVSLPL